MKEQFKYALTISCIIFLNAAAPRKSLFYRYPNGHSQNVLEISFPQSVPSYPLLCRHFMTRSISQPRPDTPSPLQLPAFCHACLAYIGIKRPVKAQPVRIPFRDIGKRFFHRFHFSVHIIGKAQCDCFCNGRFFRRAVFQLPMVRQDAVNQLMLQLLRKSRDCGNPFGEQL